MVVYVYNPGLFTLGFYYTRRGKAQHRIYDLGKIACILHLSCLINLGQRCSRSRPRFKLEKTLEDNKVKHIYF